MAPVATKDKTEELDPVAKYMADLAVSDDPELAVLQKQFAAMFGLAVTASQKANAEMMQQITNKMNERIDILQKVYDAQAAYGSVPGVGVREGNKPFSMGKLARAIVTHDWSQAGYEKEVVEAAAKVARDMGTTPDSGGGYLVPVEALQDQLIPMLKAQAIIFGLGATEIPLTRSPAMIPRVTAASTAYWVSENPTAGVTKSDLTVGQLKMSHRRIAAKVVVSDDLLDMGEAADTIINEDMSSQLGLGVDLAAFKGTGAAGEPLGLVNQIPSANTISFSGLAVGDYEWYEKLVDMEHALMNANALRGNKVGWAMHPNVLRALRKIKSKNAAAGTASGEVNRIPIDGPALKSVLGYPFATTTQLTGTSGSADLILGNFVWLLVGRWGGLMLRVSNQTSDAMEKFQTHFIASQRVDIGVRYAAGFSNGSAVAT